MTRRPAQNRLDSARACADRDHEKLRRRDGARPGRNGEHTLGRRPPGSAPGVRDETIGSIDAPVPWPIGRSAPASLSQRRARLPDPPSAARRPELQAIAFEVDDPEWLINRRARETVAALSNGDGLALQHLCDPHHARASLFQLGDQRPDLGQHWGVGGTGTGRGLLARHLGRRPQQVDQPLLVGDPAHEHHGRAGGIQAVARTTCSASALESRCQRPASIPSRHDVDRGRVDPRIAARKRRAAFRTHRDDCCRPS